MIDVVSRIKKTTSNNIDLPPGDLMSKTHQTPQKSQQKIRANSRQFAAIQ